MIKLLIIPIIKIISTNENVEITINNELINSLKDFYAFEILESLKNIEFFSDYQRLPNLNFIRI